MPDRSTEQRRHLVVDGRGVGLRATWRPKLGFVNLSLWRQDRCVETFQLTPIEAAHLVGFLTTSLAEAVPPPRATTLRAVPDEADGTTAWSSRQRRAQDAVAASARTARTRLAGALDRTARRIHPR